MVAIGYTIIISVLVFFILIAIDTIKQVKKEDERIKKISESFNKKKDADTNTNTKRGEE